MNGSEVTLAVRTYIATFDTFFRDSVASFNSFSEYMVMGDLATWVAAFATLMAVMVALRAASRESRLRRQEAERWRAISYRAFSADAGKMGGLIRELSALLDSVATTSLGDQIPPELGQRLQRLAAQFRFPAVESHIAQLVHLPSRHGEALAAIVGLGPDLRHHALELANRTQPFDEHGQASIDLMRAQLAELDRLLANAGYAYGERSQPSTNRSAPSAAESATTRDPRAHPTSFEMSSQDVFRTNLQRRDEAFMQFVKVSLTANAGGAIALLGFLQALAGKDDLKFFLSFKSAGLTSVSFFIAGAFLAMVSIWFRYHVLVTQPMDLQATDAYQRFRTVAVTSLTIFGGGAASACWAAWQIF